MENTNLAYEYYVRKLPLVPVWISEGKVAIEGTA